MTLIAAAVVEKTPVVLGDVLLTNDLQKRNEIFYPTFSPLLRGPSQRPGIACPLIAKKVHILNDRFTVAWAGSLVAAETAMILLRHAFGAKPPENAAQVKEVLAGDVALIEHAGGPLVMVGAIEGLEKPCFRWSTANPYVMESGSVFVDGSGGSFFKSIVEGEYELQAGVNLSEADRAGLFCATQVSRVFAKEALGGTIERAFGGGYDIAVLRDGRFQYLSDCTFLPVLFEGFPTGDVSWRIPVVLTCHSRDGHTLVQTSRFLDDGTLEHYLLCAIEVDAAHRKMPSVEVPRACLSPLSTYSAYTVAYLISETQRVCEMFGASLNNNANSLVFCTNKDGGRPSDVEFVVDREKIEAAVERILRPRSEGSSIIDS